MSFYFFLVVLSATNKQNKANVLYSTETRFCTGNVGMGKSTLQYLGVHIGRRLLFNPGISMSIAIRPTFFFVLLSHFQGNVVYPELPLAWNMTITSNVIREFI